MRLRWKEHHPYWNTKQKLKRLRKKWLWQKKNKNWCVYKICGEIIGLSGEIIRQPNFLSFRNR
jgi:hypothetical protein